MEYIPNITAAYQNTNQERPVRVSNEAAPVVDSTLPLVKSKMQSIKNN